VPGTPLEDRPDVPIQDTVRVIATARILMPEAFVRISAGRHLMSFADQALCFLAGANSIFTSEEGRMFVTPSPQHDADLTLLADLGLHPRDPSPSTSGSA
jgi:biotin synthase